jgi:hypothetical protein
MDAAKTSTLIRARRPELSSRDLEAIEAALSGEEMLSMSALEVVLALPRGSRSVSMPWRGEHRTA